jgi:hypothetical protein
MNPMEHDQPMTHLKNRLQAISWEPWLLIASGALMANISWLKWPDLVIDFGEQAYIAWRLSEGDILYRDIQYGYGPLSSYLHALLFKLFGAQLLVLFVFNLILVILLTFLIYRLFKFFGTRLSATVAGSTFLIVFAFAQYLWMGNHNFICSYVYGLTHGIFLCFLAAHYFQAFVLTRLNKHLYALGFITGLILLTKIEVSLAWMTGITVGLIFVFKSRQFKFKDWIRHVGLFILFLSLPIIGFAVYFSFHMGITQALHVMLLPFSFIWNAPVLSLPFYEKLMGIDAIGDNLITMNYYLLSWILLFLLLAATNNLFRNYFKSSRVLTGLGIALFFSALAYFQSQIPWLELLRPLPLMMLGLAIYASLSLFMKKESDPVQFAKLVVQFTLTVFSLTLLLKIFLKTHVYHYGTALAMPATLLLFKFLIDDLPEKIRNYLQTNYFYKASALAAIALFIFSHYLTSLSYYSKKVFPISESSDRIVGYHPNIEMRSIIFQVTLDTLKDNIKTGETLTTIPSGALLNYLTRTPKSTNTIYINPVSIKLAGEDHMLSNLKEQLPSYIAIVYHDFYEFEYRFFGKDYGNAIYQWILKDYDSFKLIGKDPVKGEGFGIHLYKLRSATPD